MYSPVFEQVAMEYGPSIDYLPCKGNDFPQETVKLPEASSLAVTIFG